MEFEAKSDGHKPRKKTKRVVARLFVVLILLCAGALCVVLFLKYREAVDSNPTNIEQKTVETVSRLVETPDEKPTVVTVQDASKLSNPELASRAQDEDRLLVYPESRRVVIFRPSSGKIVDILSIKDQTVSPSQEPAGITPVTEEKATTPSPGR